MKREREREMKREGEKRGKREKGEREKRERERKEGGEERIAKQRPRIADRRSCGPHADLDTSRTAHTQFAKKAFSAPRQPTL